MNLFSTTIVGGNWTSDLSEEKIRVIIIFVTIFIKIYFSIFSWQSRPFLNFVHIA